LVAEPVRVAAARPNHHSVSAAAAGPEGLMRFTIPELVSIVVGVACLAMIWRTWSFMEVIHWYAVHEIEARTERVVRSTGPARRRRARPAGRRRRRGTKS
jgi:hypothetical protein